MNIVKRELRAHMKSLLIWFVSIAVIVFMMMSEFSAYYQNDDMLSMVAEFSDMFKMFGLSMTDITTAGGFLSLASFYFYILGGIYGGLLGSSIIAKEERDKTCEFFLVLPISRQSAITSKLIAAVILNVLLNVATIGSVLIALIPYEKEDKFYSFILLLTISMLLIQLIFMSIGMLLSAVLKRYKKSGTYSISILLMLYLVSVFAGLRESLENLKYLTPFKYFDAAVLLNNKSIEPIYLIISLAVIGLCIVGTYLIYPKRDLKI